MYLREVITLLRSEIPKLSTKYSETVAISTIVQAAGIVTVVTSTDHDLETGDFCTIVDALQRTGITSITRVLSTVTIVTTIPHNLTLDYENSDDQPKVTISGCSIAAYNDDWDLDSVDDRNTFTFTITGTPANAVDGFLLEKSVGGFSGLKTVTRVNNTTFTFTVSTSIPTLAAAGQGGTVHHTVRFTGAINTATMINAYSKQTTDNWWGFVIPGTTVSSKNRNILSDSTDMPTPGDEYRQKLITTFSLFVVVPSKTDIGGRATYDEIIEETPSLFKALLGAKFESPYTIDSFSKVILEGHSFFTYVKAYLIYQFEFSITDELIQTDFYSVSDEVAFRDIEFSQLNTDGETLMETEIELDN